jgi:ABC-type transport system substrate-binding protein
MPWFPPRLPERCGEWTGLAVPRNTARNPVGTHRETLRVTPRASDGLGSKSSREETNESQKWPFTLLVLAGLLFAAPVAAQKSGGVLKIQHMDTPPSASIHEEATVSAAVPFMSLYNNLVMFDQHAPKNSLETVVPDLATKWDWKDDNRKLFFVLREGVKWHDGQPFTAKDVACTFDLLLGGETKLRRNPRSAWWTNVVKVTADMPGYGDVA